MVLRLIESAKSQIFDVEMKEVDITEHPEVAVKYRVMATPAIAINGRLEFLGVPREDALLERLHSVGG